MEAVWCSRILGHHELKLLVFGLNHFCMLNILIAISKEAALQSFCLSNLTIFTERTRTSLISYPVLRLWSVFLLSIVTALTVG